MTQRSKMASVSTRRALCSLALLLGTATGCPTQQMPYDAQVGDQQVASVAQALEQIFDEPFAPFGTVAAPCTDDQKNAILSPPDAMGDTAVVDCSLTLEPDEWITRRLIFDSSSSGVVLDCQDQLRTSPTGGEIPASISRNKQNLRMIHILSNYRGSVPEKDPVTGLFVGDRPENIVIANCSVDGSVRISGLRTTANIAKSSHDFRCPGEGPTSTRRCIDHVRRLRYLAPTNILFNNVKVIARGSTPLYVDGGVTRFTMMNSVLDGRSGSDVGMYLDMESTENTILNSRFSVVSDKAWPASGREQLAVDGSSYNFIVGNRVSGLNNGGFLLYRNCGEHKIIRYTTPSYNVIFGNQFNYRKFSNPPRQAGRGRYAVELSSRNGPYSYWNNYCTDDIYPPEGPWEPFPTNDDSSYSTDKDNAHDNIVTSNEFLNRLPADYMRSGTSLFNYTAGNREVREFSSDEKACWAPWSFGRVLAHGTTDHVTGTFDGIDICFGYTCNNGVLEAETEQICPDPGRPIHVECRAEQDNNGCQTFLSCPVGQKLASVKAACNLELGAVSDSELSTVPQGSVRVVRDSDRRSDGACYVLDANISTGAKALTVRQNVRTVNIGCKEKDSNGGDCHVRAEFTCQ